MKTAARKRKTRETGDDLWSWAERRESSIVREEPPPPPQPGWCRGFLKKISGQKDGPL
ncbi:MAG: hypothetical protein WC003_12305 [Terrimicrobiaceae bacterium]